MSALTRCLIEEAAAIAATAQRLDGHQVEAALGLLDQCIERRAKLVITGVGKSGIVARKIAATFSSIGLMAIYLNPLDALHGDLGVVAPDDVTLLLSNSGETQELLEILPHLRRRGTGRIALVGRVESSLARGCDVVLEGPQAATVYPYEFSYRNGVEQIDGKWYTKYSVVDMEQEAKDALDAQQAKSVREQRNQKLTETDWMVIKALESNTPQNFEMAAYRQALRDITAQPGFPWTIDWPVAP